MNIVLIKDVSGKRDRLGEGGNTLYLGVENPNSNQQHGGTRSNTQEGWQAKIIVADPPHQLLLLR
jgi:hypothetical protein